MKYFLFLLPVFFLSAPSISQAGPVYDSADLVGVGYLAKSDGTKVYQRSEGDAVVATVPRDFPLVAFESKNEWLGISASESIEGGRAHVRYWKNGQNSKAGENTAWVDLKDVERFRFDCCGDNGHCSGITNPLFKTGGYTDCFTQAMTASIQKRTPPAAPTAAPAPVNGAAELEKLKLQVELERIRLEIEKLKLEQERLKSGVK
jgi:hypothetical protein